MRLKPLLAFSFFVIFGATRVFACGCGSGSGPTTTFSEVTSALNGSTAVFAGKVVGFEYRKGIPNEFMQSIQAQSDHPLEYETKVVKFEVNQWWKLAATSVIYLVSDETKNTDGTGSSGGCDYPFKKGETYLVYARGTENELRPSACSRTAPLNRAGEDLNVLGKGNEPVSSQ